jgi:hypothetical protein
VIGVNVLVSNSWQLPANCAAVITLPSLGVLIVKPPGGGGAALATPAQQAITASGASKKARARVDRQLRDRPGLLSPD